MTLRTREDLVDLLRLAASDRITLQVLEEKFTEIFLHRRNWPLLDPEDSEFFQEVLDRVDLTAEAPTDEDRSFGWLDFGELKACSRIC